MIYGVFQKNTTSLVTFVSFHQDRSCYSSRDSNGGTVKKQPLLYADK